VTAGGDERRYFRAVEEAWSRLRARPTVLSPRDFEIVDGWRRRGIPLGVVLEVFDHAAKRRVAVGRRSLAYLASAVEEAWATVAGGRATSAVEPRPAAPSRPLPPRGVAAGTPLDALLRRLREEADAGVAPAVLDERLDEALPRLAPPEMVARAERETAEALASFRSRMRADEFAKTFSRARADRLRAELSLPRSTRGG
jgi:hypothetical protein